MTVEQLIAWNKGVDKGALRPGQELLVRNPS
ncbi:MAG: LysM domain-containing protein [Pirellulaceae bacterium]